MYTLRGNDKCAILSPMGSSPLGSGIVKVEHRDRFENDTVSYSYFGKHI